MNRHKKKKSTKIASGYTNSKQRKKNKELCKRYPFLIPRSVFTDQPVWMHKAYDWTLAEDFKDGWWKAFGLQMCEEIREDCIKYNYLNQLRLEQIKSKFGQLRCYTGPIPKDSQINNIIEDYSRLSENICEYCGRPDVNMINWGGWLYAICEDCFNRINKRSLKRGYIKELPSYSSYICHGDDGKMSEERRVTICKGDGTTEPMTYDLHDKAEQIRARWRAKHE